MDGTWSRLRSVYPYAPSRYTNVRGDDDVEKLKQPLIDSSDLSDDNEQDDDADSEDPLADEEAGLLHRDSNRDASYYSSSNTHKHKRQQWRSNAFLASVEPKFVRSISRITALAASTFGSPFAPTPAAATATATPPSLRVATNSAPMVESIRSVVRTRRKTDDTTEQVLARLALLTVLCTLLLVLGVAAHAL